MSSSHKSSVVRWRLGVVLGVTIGGTGAGATVACEQKVKESHRHLAEEYCNELVDEFVRCDSTPETPWVEDARQDLFDGCVSDPAWDWTDECGEKFWTKRQCRLNEVPCEEWDSFDWYESGWCHDEYEDFRLNCSYYGDHGR